MLRSFKKTAPDVRPRRVTPRARIEEADRVPPSTWVEVPKAYTAAARWTPGIGENFPNFASESTDGPITLHPYISGHWTIFFSIAAAFSDTCTHELGQMAAIQDDLRREGVRVLGVAQNSVEELQDWRETVGRRTGQRVNIPILADPDSLLTEAFGMILRNGEDSSAIRKTIIIDPNLRVSMLFEYPLYISRSLDETLRALDAARGYYEEQEAVRKRF